MGYLLSSHCAQTTHEIQDSPGQPGDQAGDRLIGEPGEAVDDFGPPREGRVGLDPGGDDSFEPAQFRSDRPCDRGQGLSNDGRRLMLALLLDPIFRVFQGAPRLDQTVDSSRAGSWGWGPPSGNASANRAIVSASMGSFLASRPAALAK